MEPTREQAYRRRIAELEAANADLKALVAELRVQVARLSERIAKLSKNSSNSSKPPSSDIVKPSKPASGKKTKRKISGQPGHAKHERPPFSREEIDDVREYRLNRCPDCGGALSARRKETRVVRQVELIERPIEIVEHRGRGDGRNIPHRTPADRTGLNSREDSYVADRQHVRHPPA